MDRLLIVYLVIINIIAFAIEDAKNSMSICGIRI